jgi:hypothetical protein
MVGMTLPTAGVRRVFADLRRKRVSRGNPPGKQPASLILYPGTSGSTGFRLAIHNISGLRGARIVGRPIDIEQELQRRSDAIGADDGTPLLDEDDLLVAVLSQGRLPRAMVDRSKWPICCGNSS